LASTEKHYHAVQFYKDESSLASTAAQFLADGLRSGQPGLVIATRSHTDTIVRELTARGLSVDALRTTGELQFFDAHKMLASFMFGGLPESSSVSTQPWRPYREAVRRAHAVPHSRVWRDGGSPLAGG
jgi:KaiC/GvpD/RAD55 family RecA-like ATPase